MKPARSRPTTASGSTKGAPEAAFSACASAEAFANEAGRWRDLYRRGAPKSLYTTYGWTHNWLTQFGGTGGHVLLGERDGRLTCGVLLVNGGNRLMSPTEHMCWPALLSDIGRADAWREPLTALRRGTPIPRQTLLLGGIRDEERTLFLDGIPGYEVFAKGEVMSAVTDVNRTFDSFMKSRSGRVRSQLKKKRRRFCQQHPRGGLQTLTKLDRIDEVMAIIHAVEVDSWKHEARTSIASSPAETAFYRQVYLERGDACCPQLDVLRLNDGSPIAFILSVIHDGTYYLLKTSYRQDAAELSPGQVVLNLVIEAQCESDSSVRRIALLGRRQPRWKSEVATAERRLQTFELRPNTIANRAYGLAYRQLRPRLAEAIQRASRHPVIANATTRLPESSPLRQMATRAESWAAGKARGQG